MTSTIDPALNPVLRQVVSIVRETLGLPDDEPIRPDHLLFYDLDFTSLDLLDLLFRLEDQFDVAIPEGTLYGLARGELDDEAFCRDSILTPRGRAQLMALLSDTPAQMFPEKIHAQTLPRYCSVAAFARLVAHKLDQRERDV